MKSRIICVLTILFGVLWIVTAAGRRGDKNPVQKISRVPVIEPDYSGCVIPPNIAPLNFSIMEPGIQYDIRIASENGKPIKLRSRSAAVHIPLKAWKRLLLSNIGQDIVWQIKVQLADHQWIEFQSVVNHIAEERIDPFLVYRLLQPMYFYWGEMGLYERNLENFDEHPVLLSRAMNSSCMNCHVFCKQDPEKMIFHIRGGQAAGTLLVLPDRIQKINTKTEFSTSAAVYPVWHPNGKMLTFSVNELRQFFHAVGESREVVDHFSDLILYHIDSNTITTDPKIANPAKLETFPEWSPDGRYLYFCSAEPFHAIQDYEKIRYNLVRIAYDIETGFHGEPEMILSAEDTGRSALLPRISPDGQYMLFCMTDHGNFPAFMKSSDLYIMNLQNKKYRPLDIVNSNNTEGYHAWSGNSSWFVYASKKQDNLCARLYFCHVDSEGRTAKSFILPQERPDFYQDYLKTYNLPELIHSPVRISSYDILKAANRDPLQAVLDPEVEIPQYKQPLEENGQIVPQ